VFGVHPPRAEVALLGAGLAEVRRIFA
jgi:hypothetical protein